MLEDLLGQYWDVAYNEGKEGRDHDTADGIAQRTLSMIFAEVGRLISEEREQCAIIADEAANNQAEKVYAEETGQYETDELLAVAWQFSVIAARMRARNK